MACLEVTGPREQKSIHPLDSDKISIGRSAGSDIVLPDPSISRHQALVYQKDSHWFIEDLGSRNGTLVNRWHITSPVELSDGMKIQLGSCRAVFFKDDVRSLDSITSGETLGGALGPQTSLDSIVQQFLMAREIQRFLLPRSSPELDGYLVFGESQPCYEVGGDFYDYRQRSDGTLGVFVGDVARKGFGSAVLGHYTQATIRTAFDYESDLGKLATRINRDIYSHTASNQFVTAFLCILHPDSNILTYVNAGHCPPLLVREDGSTEFLPGYNLLLGVVDSAEYATSRVKLEPGDTCILYSDGITEYSDPQDNLFGEKRLSQFFATRGMMEPERIVRELEAELEHFAKGSQPRDDVTLVLVRRLA